MKKFLKRLAIITLGLFTLSIMNITTLHASETTTLVVNYYRFDGDYDDWSLWLWQNEPNAGGGQQIRFNGTHESGAAQLTYELDGTHLEGSTKVGVIVRTDGWLKDVSMDLFIDLSNPDSNGVVEVFLVTEDPKVYYADDDLDLSDRVQRADFNDVDELGFKATTPNLSETQVSVYENDAPLTISDFDVDGFNYTVRFDRAIDLTKEYVLEVDFGDDRGALIYDIGFRGIYDSEAFNDAYAYDGGLGVIYDESESTFKLWAPISSAVSLNLYETGHSTGTSAFTGAPGVDEPFSTHELSYVDKGVWEVTVSGDMHGVYYTFDVTNGEITHEVVDPYTRSTGVNGKRGMVVDFDRLNPANWQYGFRPNTITHFTDAIVYEAHIRDYTSHETWNGTEEWRGKYLGFSESGTTYQSVKTGFDHFTDLGVTHVQLLPVHDIGMAIDETKIEDEDYRDRMDTIFNWGYMTLHFNTLEGSYATDPFDGEVRIREFKQMVQNFHDNDIRIILDVVYNHTATSGDSNFEKIVPGYYFRFDEDGQFSNGSGTGNETASEHQMMRKFMVDSLRFWTEEYNISGYRFDLMRLHDVKTMQEIKTMLHEIDDTLLIYGEPWDAGGSQLDPAEAADGTNMDRMPGIGAFNDGIRDGVKGSVFNASDPGWVQGLSTMRNNVRQGIVGGIAHPDIPSGLSWTTEPYQSISYVTAHDNNTLHDKLMLSTEDVTFDQIKAMQNQSNAIVLTAQGVPFLHGGVEMMRTKPCVVIDGQPQGECDSGLRYDHNSYRSPDATNQIDWNWKVDHQDVFDYHKGLIELRRHTDIFNMRTAEEIREHLYFLPTSNNFIAYMVSHPDSAWENTIVAHNNANANQYLDLYGLEWNLVVNKDQAGLETIEVVSGNSLTVRPNETVVLYRLARGAEWPEARSEIRRVVRHNENDSGEIIIELGDGRKANVGTLATDTENPDITLRYHEGFIQWRYAGSDTWSDLIAYDALEFESPDDGMGMFAIVLVTGTAVVVTTAAGMTVFYFTRKRQ